jgi:hypothetical protein
MLIKKTISLLKKWVNSIDEDKLDKKFTALTNKVKATIESVKEKLK